MFFVLVLEKQPIRTLYAIYMYKVFWLDDFVVPVQNLHWENLWLSTGLLSLFLENIYNKRKKKLFTKKLKNSSWFLMAWKSKIEK